MEKQEKREYVYYDVNGNEIHREVVTMEDAMRFCNLNDCIMQQKNN